MLDVHIAAQYISQRYREKYGSSLDEMKLHKLLYFAQRECILSYGSPLFPNQFEAWKYGPVMRCVRGYKFEAIEDPVTQHPELRPYISVFDKVLEVYAPKNSWTLSSVSHGEISWQEAKKKETNSTPIEILTEDIRKDAERVRFRRVLFN